MASNIIPGNVDGTYPKAGQDNSSQGFRDNFSAIVTNFTEAKTEIEDLQTNKASTNANTNFSDYVVSKAVFKDTAETVYPHGVIGGGSVTLNYEKFLFNGNGKPVRRYPRKYSAYDMEEDIVALLGDKELAEESPVFLKSWREAKREAIKSEYAFRYNYNYYSAPDSMYKYDKSKDATVS